MTIHRLSHGGADRVAILLANGFAAHGLPTALAVLRESGEGEGTLVGLLCGDVQLDSAGPPLGSRHLELVRGLRYITGLITSARPAVVLASSSNMGLVTGLSARLMRGRGPRFVMKLTNPVIRPRDRGPLHKLYRRLLYRFIFGSYEMVLVLSHAERIALSDMFPSLRDRFSVIANPYITAEMLAGTLLRARTEPARIVTAARMMPQKRLDRLLRAFALVADQNCRLTILGDGPGRLQLQQLADDLGIADRVNMPGFVEDVVPFLRDSDVFVLSSDYEGLPAAIFEALACNVPVVTTNCFAGAGEMLAGVPGCAVIARDNIAAFAQAIDHLIADHARPQDLRARAQPYEVGTAVADHVSFLTRLIGAGAGKRANRLAVAAATPP